MCACMSGVPALVELLLEAGCDPCQRDALDQTGLDLCQQYKNVNGVHLPTIVEAGMKKWEA